MVGKDPPANAGTWVQSLHGKTPQAAGQLGLRAPSTALARHSPGPTATETCAPEGLLRTERAPEEARVQQRDPNKF